MSDSDDLFQQFKNNILQSLKSPSPKITRKRKLSKSNTQMDSNDSDIDSIIESPNKKPRTINHNTNTENNIDEDIEFNQLFDINEDQPNDNSKNTNNINSIHKSPRKCRRYFNTPNEQQSSDDNSTDGIEKMNVHSKPKNITFKCYNCDESGHIARNCPYETVEICFKCGESGHSGFYCSNNICSHCLKSHPLHECNLFQPNKTIFRFCIRCGSFDHYINQCDILLNHRLTDLQCFVCGKYGHLNCKSNTNYKSKRIQLCSNCGDDGHTYSFCKHLKMNKAEIAIGLNTQPNEPKICYNCNEPNHNSRNCPLIIRQKQQRKKINKQKFNYRSMDKGNRNNNKRKFKMNKKKEMNKSVLESIKKQNEKLLKLHDF